MIESYEFGRIAIDGKTYTADVIILPDRVEPNWWRTEGHGLVPADLKTALEAKPAVLIVGLGAASCMKIPQATKEFLRQQKIELIAADTKTACAEFNKRVGGGRVVAALHLTC